MINKRSFDKELPAVYRVRVALRTPFSKKTLIFFSVKIIWASIVGMEFKAARFCRKKTPCVLRSVMVFFLGNVVMEEGGEGGRGRRETENVIVS